MIVLVSGGVKNGKSTYAEELCLKLANGNKHYYLATMLPYDDEDRKRVKKHQENRKDKNFDTIEIAYDINNVLSISDTNSTYLLDSLTALVLNEMFKYENKLSNDELTNKINNDLDELCKNVDNIVIVTDYIFSDAIYVSQFTEDYLKIFANVSCHLAQISDCVVECVLGCHKFIKGKI